MRYKMKLTSLGINYNTAVIAFGNYTAGKQQKIFIHFIFHGILEILL